MAIANDENGANRSVREEQRPSSTSATACDGQNNCKSRGRGGGRAEK